MNDKNLISILLIIVLAISVIGELIALWTGQFANNTIPFATHFYNVTLIGFIIFYSIEPKKEKPLYLPLQTNLKNNINKQAEKYYISKDRGDYQNAPDTEEIWIKPSTKEKYYDTCDFDEKTIEYIRQQRYKSAANYLNSLQDNKKDV